ncbi:MAG: acetolactate decarboxylase [Candidatus Omnitrophica bacterium]|nr:acetolactate decarboxylase [Candidatus Omnitrophota bacterium]
MKISKVFFKLSLLAVLIYGLSLLLTFRAPDREIIYQVSIFSALMKGDYEGEIKLKNLKKQGDLGIGTFNALDGEMIELDSKFYQVKSDGKVYLAGDSAKTPFAAVTFFDVDRRVFLNQTLDFEGLTKFIDSFIPNKNILYAIKIEGKFEYVKARSVRRQEKPYLPLLEVVKAQSTFEFTNIDGTIVGFRLPK